MVASPASEIEDQDPAKSAAMLRRQFGMMINARKMMSMTGAERTEYLRKQFQKTGKSFEKMGRIEKKALASRLGMSVKEAAALFGKGNKEKALNKVREKGRKAQKKEINQAKILLHLSKQIERQFQSGSGGYKSFFDAFVGGFQKGIMRSRAFRKVLINISRSLRVVERAGIRVGRSFVNNFPGVKKMLGALAKFFDPRNISRNMRKVSGAFDRFFKGLHKPGGVRKALDGLFAELTAVFREFFDFHRYRHYN